MPLPLAALKEGEAAEAALAGGRLVEAGPAALLHGHALVAGPGQHHLRAVQLLDEGHGLGQLPLALGQLDGAAQQLKGRLALRLLLGRAQGAVRVQ